MNHALLVFKMDYADEFDVEGLRLLETDKLYDILNKLDKYKDKEYEWYFGTNEFLLDTVDRYLDNITVYFISNDEKDFLSHIIGEYGFGHSPDLVDMLECFEQPL